MDEICPRCGRLVRLRGTHTKMCNSLPLPPQLMKEFRSWGGTLGRFAEKYGRRWSDIKLHMTDIFVMAGMSEAEVDQLILSKRGTPGQKRGHKQKRVGSHCCFCTILTKNKVGSKYVCPECAGEKPVMVRLTDGSERYVTLELVGRAYQHTGGYWQKGEEVSCE